jgi:hypothetical protein
MKLWCDCPSVILLKQQDERDERGERREGERREER